MNAKKQDFQQIVIIGGGAGGLILASRLGRFAKRHPQANLKIILVDQMATHIWKPLLHEVAAGTLNSYQDEIPYFLHGSKNGYEFIQGRVTDMDVQNNKIRIDPIEDEEGRPTRDSIELGFDQAVLAFGSVSNNFNVAGVDQFCYKLDSRMEAERLHRQILAYLLSLKFKQEALKESLQESLQEAKKETPFYISIIGGGATGVELAAELKSTLVLLKESHNFKNINDQVKIRIIEAGDSLLAGQDSAMIEQATAKVQALNIEVCTKMQVSAVESKLIHIKDSEALASNLHIWATGIKVPSGFKSFSEDLFNKIGQIKVNQFLQVDQNSNIYALGDCAELVLDGKRLGPRAQVAQQQAVYLAKRLCKSINPDTAFKFHEKGSIVSIGEKYAVGTMKLKGQSSLHIKGHLARAAYTSLYRTHQLELLGWFKGALVIIKSMLGRVTGPRVKLH